MSDATELAETNDRLFAEALRRACKQPQGRSVLVLHLSRMKPPAPRPHHRRVARAVLQDAAQRFEGQVFLLANGDMALLCRTPGLSAPLDRRDGGGEAPTDKSAPSASDIADLGRMTLPDMLARLLRVDAPDPAALISQWPIERSAEPLLRYVRSVLSETTPAPAVPEMSGLAPTRAAQALGELIKSGQVQELMQRQTGVALAFSHGDGGLIETVLGHAPSAGGGPTLRPIYKEASFSIAALEARIRATAPIAADPFLFRHLAGRLDQRMLRAVRAELGSGGPLDLLAGRRPGAGDDGAGAGAGSGLGPPLNLNLTLECINSDSFRLFAAECQTAGATLGVEISVIEACADSRAYFHARDAARDAGMSVLLDGVSYLALQYASPAALEADLTKLEWSPRMADLRGDDEVALRSSLDAVGAHRVVLQRAETEAAIRWGLRHGIRRFQGRHIDAMLGASRIKTCPLARACTLRQCVERASATAVAGRAGCGNLPLLDSGMSSSARPIAARPASVAAAAVRASERSAARTAASVAQVSAVAAPTLAAPTLAANGLAAP